MLLNAVLARRRLANFGNARVDGRPVVDPSFGRRVTFEGRKLMRLIVTMKFTSYASA